MVDPEQFGPPPPPANSPLLKKSIRLTNDSVCLSTGGSKLQKRDHVDRTTEVEESRDDHRTEKGAVMIKIHSVPLIRSR